MLFHCRKILIVLVTMYAALLHTTAHAALVQWSVSNISFDDGSVDGATLNGTFTVNTADGTVPTFNLFFSTTQALNRLFTSGGADFANLTGGSITFVDIPPLFSAGVLLLTSDTGSFNAANSLSLSGSFFPSGQGQRQFDIFPDQVARLVVEPQEPSTVPEPSTLAMFGLAMGALAMLHRRRKGTALN